MKIKKIIGKKFIKKISNKNIDENIEISEENQGQDFFKFMRELHIILEKERIKIAEENDKYE